MLTISSQCFRWDSSCKTLSADASDLQSLGKTADNGFYVRSHRTGRTLWFRRHSEQRNREGELESVTFVSTEMPDIKLIVFND